MRLGRSTSVFAAKDGNFRMPTLERGTYDLRVRRVGYEDLSKQGISLQSQPGDLNLTMIAETDPNESRMATAGESMDAAGAREALQ